MSRAEAKNQPSVEELLVSIRQAIHGDGSSPLHQAASKPSNGSPVSGSMSQTRVSLQTNSGQQTGFTQQHSENFLKLRSQLEQQGAGALHAVAPVAPAAPQPRANSAASGFAGILNGDVRLEEALEKLKRAGLGGEVAAVHHVEPPQEFRASQFEDDADEYTAQEYVEEEGHYEEDYEYAPQPAQYDQPDSFSPQTRQAYIEPVVEPEVEFQPLEQPAPEPQPTPQPTPQALAPISPPVPSRAVNQPLTSKASAAETSAAFNRLADTIVGHATTGERSIDELTRDLLRPMLQSWLDENLPRLVERLVREEIERVARWGGK